METLSHPLLYFRRQGRERREGTDRYPWITWSQGRTRTVWCARDSRYNVLALRASSCNVFAQTGLSKQYRPISVTVEFLLILRKWKFTTITKTRLYNFDPLKPHFYIVKLGFTGEYIIFLISAHNIDCWYSLEPPRRGGSNEYPHSMFWAEIRKISEFFIWKFSFFFGGKIFSIFE